MSTPTAREEVLDVLRAQGWGVKLRAGAIVGTWRKRSIAITFGSDGRITAASKRYPLPRNAGMTSGPVEAPMRANVLAFIRGEERKRGEEL
jgi:hypothetical protein